MTEKPEASVLTARRAAQHFRLSSADDACEHLYILIVRSSLGPSPPNAGRYTVASRFRRRAWIHFPRAPEQFVTSPLCLVGYVRWDARSDRVPPLQTIIFSSFTGRTKGCRLSIQIRLNHNCASQDTRRRGKHDPNRCCLEKTVESNSGACRLSILGPGDHQPENNPLPLRVCSPCLNLIRFQIRAAFWMDIRRFFVMTI